MNSLKVINETVWDIVKNSLKRKLGQATFNSWIKPLDFVAVEGKALLLAAPTRFIADWVMSNYKVKMIELSNGQIQSVNIVVRTMPKAEAAPAVEVNTVAEIKSAQSNVVELVKVSESFGSKIDPRFTFDSFITAHSNELALAAAKRVAESGYDAGFNPLFLHSGVGLGKTHLMHAIANYNAEKFPNRKVVYLSAEKFMHSYVKALKDKNIIEFKNALRSADILMIDDFQFIAGKESTQEEFFHTVTSLVEGGKQLVISCDRCPSDFENLPERMRSRLASGLVVDIHSAQLELRMKIMRAKAAAANISIPEDVIMFLAEKITSNIRELEGAFNRIVARVSLVKGDVTIESAKSWLADLLKIKEKSVSIEDIQDKVAGFYNLKTSELLSSTRKANIARARQIAMYLAKTLTTKSLADIGKMFGGKDHTTVLHACRKMEELVALDSAMDNEIQGLISKIKN